MAHHEFDLLEPETWANLPPAEDFAAAVLTFPVSSLPTAARFWEEYLREIPTVICYSSSSMLNSAWLQVVPHSSRYSLGLPLQARGCHMHSG